jgi:hypothetical protein
MPNIQLGYNNRVTLLKANWIKSLSSITKKKISMLKGEIEKKKQEKKPRVKLGKPANLVIMSVRLR